MTTFLEAISGVETSQPREYILFETPAMTLGVALGTRDLLIDGRTYYAIPADRGEVQYAMADNDADMTLKLPVSHAIPQRWMFGRVPPMYVNVTLYQLQVLSGLSEVIWRGKVESMEIDLEDVATLRVPARLTDELQRRIPQITIGTGCPHVLYDANCRVDRDGFKVETQVATIDGRKLTVDDMDGHATDWATFGEILHVASGERMTIASQIGNEITMQLNIPGIAIDDEVIIYAGCAHDILTCGPAKFDNKSNFGGYPYLPAKNPTKATGLGVLSVITQE